jgi:hypothetical protein
MSSRFAVVLTLLLLVGPIAGAMPAAAVPDARLTVSDVAVTPGTPVTGAPVTVTVTVSNGGGSPEALAVDEIRLVEDGDVVARSVDPGSLSPGGTLSVPLTARFGDPGQHDLTIQVRTRDEDDERIEVQRPLTLVVEAAPPLVELDTTELVTDSETTTPVVVSNPTTDAMRNVVVSLATGNGEAVVARRTVPSLAAGTAETLNFTVRAARAGEATLSVSVDYTTGSGTRATETYDHRVGVVALEDDVGVRVADAPVEEEQPRPGGQLGVLLGGDAGAGGGTTRDGGDDEAAARVAVTVSNFGNAPIENVVATPRVGETTLARVGVPGPLAPGEEEQVIVPLDRAPGGDLVVDVTYDVGTGRERVTGRYDFRPRTGAVRITGVDLAAETEEGVVRITGNAGNVGRGSVTGLVLSVGRAEGVTPAYPQRDYFVGTVEGSEFAPFELTARVDTANASTVPVVVTYAVDGDVREETVALPVDDDLGSEERSDRRLPLSVWLGAVGVALAAAAAVVIRRR